jgi:copper chaperone NosL
MIRAAAIAVLLLAISSCRNEEAAAPPPPVTMSEEALGYYCQMLLIEHPGPKGQIHLDGLPEPIHFSQVRDAIAYLRMPEQSHAVRAVYVSDMGVAESWETPGRDNWIAAEAAYYVVGSDRVGGMGAPEFVPFSARDAAEAFARDHGGAILGLNEIADDMVLAPVDFPPNAAGAKHLHGHGDE